jgi:hypothetical protein
MGALSAHGESAPVTHTLIGTDLDLALDVLGNIATQVTLDLEVLLEESPDSHYLVVGEVSHFGPSINLEVVAYQMGSRLPDPVDIGESDFQSLFPRKIYTCNTSHPTTPDAACAVDWSKSPKRGRAAG